MSAEFEAVLEANRGRKLLVLMEYLDQIEDWECEAHVKRDLMDILARGEWNREGK